MSDQPRNHFAHIRFSKINYQSPRYKRPGGGGSGIPHRNYPEHARLIEHRIEEIQEEFLQTPSIVPEFDPELIFVIHREGEIKDSQLRTSNLAILSEEPNNFIVLFSQDQLREFSTKTNAYGRGVPPVEGRINPENNWIGAIDPESMRRYSRNDRIGKKLIKELSHFSDDREFILDIVLFNIGSYDEIKTRMNALQNHIESAQGKFLDSFIHSSMSVARVKITGVLLNDLLEIPFVQTIDLPPVPFLSIGDLIKTPLDDFENPIMPPSESATTICVIDSGVISGHPMIRPAFGDARSFPDSIGNPSDVHGHGTNIGGIALYGNVRASIESLNFSPELVLLSARVTNENNKFDDEKLIVHQMDEAIRYFCNLYDCRVFNISLGDPDLLYSGGKPSPWTYILDVLARELNIVIVVSAGNITNLKITDTYPTYFHSDDHRLIEPAIASNAITVGSIAENENSMFAMQYPNDPSIRALAKLNQPSPFSRRGPGINNAIKPDVCEYGGNVTWRGDIRQIVYNDRENGVISLNREFTERLFCINHGTSFAAPKIAHLAAKILNQYPNSSANLVRALIANSATIPEAFYELFNKDSPEGRENIINLGGYGKPDYERAVFSTDNRVTLISEDVIAYDSIHIYRIEIPEEFIYTTGNRQVSITLAFDPPVRHTNLDYLGIKLEFHLFRGVSEEQVKEWFSERPQSDNTPNPTSQVIERIDNKYKCKLLPGALRRNKGTLQKGIFPISVNRSLQPYSNEPFHIVVQNTGGWANKEEYPNQRYALVVTFEHLSAELQLYNILREQTRLRPRVRT